MNELTLSRGKFVAPLFIAAAVVLMGAGCGGGGTTGSDDDSGGFIIIPSEAGVISDFSGTEGSLTEFAFDKIAEEYNVWLAEQEYAGGTDSTLRTFLSGDGSHLPVNDAYQNEIRAQNIDLDNYLLYSNGEDTYPSTMDDYYKAYQD